MKKPIKKVHVGVGCSEVSQHIILENTEAPKKPKETKRVDVTIKPPI